MWYAYACMYKQMISCVCVCAYNSGVYMNRHFCVEPNLMPRAKTGDLDRIAGDLDAPVIWIGDLDGTSSPDVPGHRTWALSTCHTVANQNANLYFCLRAHKHYFLYDCKKTTPYISL